MGLLIMKGKGFRVLGSDISINKNIERLKKEKIKVLIGHQKQNLNKATILAVSYTHLTLPTKRIV